MRFRPFAMLAVAAMLAVGFPLAGCGQNNNPPPATSTTVVNVDGSTTTTTPTTTPASPREVALTVGRGYSAVLIGVGTALTLPDVIKNPATKAKIKAVSALTTGAFLDYLDEAAKCVRDPKTQAIVSAPGSTCDPSALNLALASARGAIANTMAVLQTFGVAVPAS